MNLGKRPASPRPTDFRWRDLAPPELPQAPARFGHANMFRDWLMLGNGPDDTVAPGFGGCGDCVWAGAAHEHRMIWRLRHGADLKFTGAAVVGDYSAATGYVVGDATTDQGTFVREALSYRRATGIADAAGRRHLIGAYVSLDPKDWGHLMAATYIFGAVGIGFEFPASAWAQFDAGKPWDALADDGGIDGGHYVPVFGAPGTDLAAAVTWGRRQVVTRAFYERYNDESWAYVSPEALGGDGRGLHGFDVARLNSWLAALEGP